MSGDVTYEDLASAGALEAVRQAPVAVSVAISQRKQLHYADFFRALAIFYVFFGHSTALTAVPVLLHHVTIGDFIGLFDGVAMLFCLSGFLLSAPYLRAYLENDGNAPLLSAFYLARFLRIYPLYATAVIAIALFLAAVGQHPSTRDVVTHLFMLQNFSPSTIQSLSGPLWTMPLDAQFYLLLPLAFLILSRAMRGATRQQKTVALFAVLAAVIACSCAWRFFAVQHWNPVTLNDQLYVVDQFPGMVGLFMLGIAARFVLYLNVCSDLKLPRGIVPAAMLVGLAVALRIGQYVTHQSWLHFGDAGMRSRAALFASVEELLAGLGCALLLLAASQAEAGWFSRFVAGRWVAFAAAISYAFYLLHLTVLTTLSQHIVTHGYRGLAVSVGICLLILVPLCAAAHRFVEKPFLDRKARLRRTAIPT